MDWPDPSTKQSKQNEFGNESSVYISAAELLLGIALLIYNPENDHCQGKAKLIVSNETVSLRQREKKLL